VATSTRRRCLLRAAPSMLGEHLFDERLAAHAPAAPRFLPELLQHACVDPNGDHGGFDDIQAIRVTRFRTDVSCSRPG